MVDRSRLRPLDAQAFRDPGFDSLRPEFVPLNRHAVELLLNRLGVDRIRALLDRDLKQYDVRYAFYRFSKLDMNLGTEYAGEW